MDMMATVLEEVHQTKTELKEDIKSVRSDLTNKIDNVQRDLHSQWRSSNPKRSVRTLTVLSSIQKSSPD